MKPILILLSLCILPSVSEITGQSYTVFWGDRGNGTYIKPILNADYSDADIISIEKEYYLVCPEFHFMGMPFPASDDMVNWKIIARVYGNPDLPEYNTTDRYAGGSWAP